MNFKHHKYTWSNPWGYSDRHHWEFVGSTAALHFHCSVPHDKPHEFTAGLETHYFEAPEYMRDSAPTNLDCKLTGGRCWHDGTSSYAHDHLWPLIEPYVRTGEHKKIFQILEREYTERFGEKIAEGSGE